MTEKFIDISEYKRLEAARQKGKSVVLQRAADIQSEAIRWIWPGFLARGKFHLLGGAPSAGKTTLAMSLAATISAGGKFPGGYSPKPAGVVIWTGEDGIADTLRPRLEAAGADLDRVHFVSGVTEAGRSRSFDPAKDIPALEAAIAALGDVGLLVVDPVVTAVSGDGHKNSDVRRGLQPLVDMIEVLDLACIGITHFSKGSLGRDPTERITGSLAFGAMARVILVAAREEAKPGDDGEATEDRRIFTRAKSNIGLDGGGYLYAIEPVALGEGIEATRVYWGGELKGSARDLLKTAEHVEDEAETEARGAINDAVSFLLDELADGPVAVRDLQKSARENGISATTLKRAGKACGVCKSKVAGEKHGGWVAELRGQGGQGGQGGQEKATGILGHLDQCDQGVGQGGQGSQANLVGHLGHLGHLDASDAEMDI